MMKKITMKTNQSYNIDIEGSIKRDLETMLNASGLPNDEQLKLCQAFARAAQDVFLERFESQIETKDDK